MKLGKFKLNQIYCGDCLELMKDIPNNSIDLIVTDPPYGYSFMGKDWDTFEPQGAYQYKKGFKQLPRHSPGAMIEFFVPIWKESLRILKDGAFIFVMCAPRQDVLMKQIQALSEAGFNTGFTSIYWTYASGFPKAYNIGQSAQKKISIGKVRRPDRDLGGLTRNRFSGDIEGKLFADTGGKLELTSPQAQELNGSYGGFQPKPAVEVIIVAMKPLSEKTYVDQALKNKKGITWLDNGRIPYESEYDKSQATPQGKCTSNIAKGGRPDIENEGRIDFKRPKLKGRFPANLLVSDDVLNDGKITKDGGIGGRGKHGRENDKVLYRKIEEEANKHLPKNCSVEIGDNSITLYDYSKGYDQLRTIAFRDCKGKSVKEIIGLVDEILNENLPF